MCIRSHEHADHPRTALSANECFLKHANRLASLVVCNQRKSQKPIARRIVRVYCEIASELTNSFVEVTRLEQHPPHGIARHSERIQIAGTPSPLQRLLSAALAKQPSRKPEVRRGVVWVQV